MTTPQTFNVTTTRVFNAPVARVWQAWADSDDIKQWWGPTGFTVPVAKMDFRVGGTSLVCMRAPQDYGGQDSYNTWTYTTLEPNQRIEFVNNFSDANGTKVEPSTLGLPPGIPFDVPHTITFKALSPTQTEMTVTEYGYTNEQIRDFSKMGLEQCLDKMKLLLEKA